MAVLMRFSPKGLTTATYDECTRRLEKAGAGTPQGRLYHVCFGDKNNLNVSDIWASREEFERFAEKLEPVVKDLGIEPGEPEILEIHNIIAGANAGAAKP